MRLDHSDGHDSFKNSALHFHALERGLQPLSFLTFNATGYSLFQCLALLSAQQCGRNALGAGCVRLPAAGRHLAHVLGLNC